MVFQVAVRNVAGLPIPGAGLRLIAPDGTDVTASRFQASTVYTDANGLFTRFYLLFAPSRLPLGQYKIVGSALGYVDDFVLTTPFFVGQGNFVLQLTPEAIKAESSIEAPGFGYVSPMAPTEALIGGTEGYADWEYIEATITNQADESSIMEVPVVNGQARINLQARLELDPLLQLIPDDAIGVIDASFSDKLTVTLASLTASGTRPLEGEFSVMVANAFPIGDTNDLTNFTNTAGLADWLTPWDELPKFTGHPADAGVWLPIPNAGPYSLTYSFYNINKAAIGGNLSDALPADLFAPGKVVKVKIPEPIAGAYYAKLTVMNNNQAQTKPLWVRYYHG